MKHTRQLTLEESISCLKRAYSLAKAGAKRRDLEFTLTLARHSKLIMGECTYCGAKASSELNYRRLRMPKNGVDRIDNSKGYTTENCVSCCTFCNTLRASIGWDTWAGLINDVVHHRREMDELPDELPTDQRASQSYYRGR